MLQNRQVLCEFIKLHRKNCLRAIITAVNGSGLKGCGGFGPGQWNRFSVECFVGFDHHFIFGYSVLKPAKVLKGIYRSFGVVVISIGHRPVAQHMHLCSTSHDPKNFFSDGTIENLDDMFRALEDIRQDKDIHKRKMRRNIVAGNNVTVNGAELQRLERTVFRTQLTATVQFNLHRAVCVLMDQLLELFGKQTIVVLHGSGPSKIHRNLLGLDPTGSE